MNICERIDKSLDILFHMLLLCLILSSCSSLLDFEAEENETSLLWIREESQFVSYVVEDGMVFWEYEFCFKNETPYNLTISTLVISLLENQTSGWVSHQNLFICEEINGQRKAEIEAGQKIIYRVTFSGESLGGEPDVGNLFPQHVTFIVDSSDEGLKTQSKDRGRFSVLTGKDIEPATVLDYHFIRLDENGPLYFAVRSCWDKEANG